MSRGNRFWSTFASILLVLGIIGVPLSLTATAAHQFVTDPDEVVAALGPLSEDPTLRQTVTNAIAAPVHQEISSRLGIQFPGSAELVRAAVGAAVNSDAFGRLWDQSLVAMHAQLGSTLSGDPDALFSLAPGGVVELELGPAVAAAKERLLDDGVEIARLIGTAEGSLPLFRSDQIERLPGLARALDVAAAVLPWATVLCLVAAFAFTGDRRRRFMAAGIGVAVVSLVLWAVVAIARGIVAVRLSPWVGTAAAEGAYDRATTGLVQSIWLTMLLAVVVLLVSWLAGARRRAGR